MNGVVEAPSRWELLEGAVKGMGKKYSQDRCTAQRTADGHAVVLAVADGHGSAPHFRSDLGAAWAVQEFAACAGEFVNGAVRHAAAAEQQGDETLWWTALSELRAEARRLPQQVAHRWYRRAVLHDCNSPAQGGVPHGDGGGRTGDERPETGAKALDLTPCGSTLVGAVLTRRLLVCWQLGDGDVVVLDGSGTAHTPLYTGPDLGDETDSLCESEAWRRVRCHWQPLTGEGPAGLLLSTDGLSKSFTDHQGFLDFATGVRDRAAEHGTPVVRERLPAWLGHAAQYSGDDTTLVGALAAAPQLDDAAPTQATRGTPW
ncbi:protein phosphatase 2C domain-containing protein [Streptomyces europaeiscabiei]|uniref:protein phosphatase 2C domain-containing protein n=1 Tax=Streptomyces europaeiscabiei TaxID=146819 RepID=UPI0013C48803|nr:protein phosphatase 2C domain-containing protein [Streptomyces europaeiscabiei]